MRRNNLSKSQGMKISKFLDGAIAADGGTVSCRVALEDGTILEIGLDARIPKTKSEREMFIGVGYPSMTGASSLPRDSLEEREVIDAIRDYVDRNCGFLRREALLETSTKLTSEKDQSDHMATVLLAAILDR